MTQVEIRLLVMDQEDPENNIQKSTQDVLCF